MNYMQMNKYITIGESSPFTWKKRFLFFISSFSGIWLFLEPLGFFSLLPNFITDKRLITYSGMLVFSASIVVLMEAYSKWRNYSTVQYIFITIVITSTGIRHVVKTPIDIKIEALISSFLSLIQGETQGKGLAEIIKFFNVKFIVIRQSGNIEIPHNLTLREFGVNNDDVCELHGKIKNDYIDFRFLK